MGFAMVKHDDREHGFNFDITSKFIMDSAEDVNSLPDCAPGSIAYTADMSAVYQKAPSGSWVERGSGSEGSSGATADEIADMVNAIAASIGMPTFAKSVEEMTDTNKVYINGGKWYYYMGTEWAEGGVSNLSGWAAESPTLSSRYPTMEVGGIDTNTGADSSQISEVGKARSRSVGYIDYVPGTTVTVSSDTVSGEYSAVVLYYNANKEYVKNSVWTSGTFALKPYSYFRLLVKNSGITDFTNVPNDFITVNVPQSLKDLVEGTPSSPTGGK